MNILLRIALISSVLITADQIASARLLESPSECEKRYGKALSLSDVDKEAAKFVFDLDGEYLKREDGGHGGAQVYDTVYITRLGKYETTNFVLNVAFVLELGREDEPYVNRGNKKKSLVDIMGLTPFPPKIGAKNAYDDTFVERAGAIAYSKKTNMPFTRDEVVLITKSMVEWFLSLPLKDSNGLVARTRMESGDPSTIDPYKYFMNELGKPNLIETLPNNSLVLSLIDYDIYMKVELINGGKILQLSSKGVSLTLNKLPSAIEKLKKLKSEKQQEKAADKESEKMKTQLGIDGI